MESLKGKFLVATSQMPDPRFREQVIYICAHDENGVMGLAVNKPSKHSLTEVFKSAHIETTGQTFPPIYIGGPVDSESAFFLYSSEYKTANAYQISDKIHMSREPHILKDIAKGKGPEDYLFILGYAGWGGGQLERELTLNGWLALTADYEVLFNTSNERKWKKAAENNGINIELFSDEIGLA